MALLDKLSIPHKEPFRSCARAQALMLEGSGGAAPFSWFASTDAVTSEIASHYVMYDNRP